MAVTDGAGAAYTDNSTVDLNASTAGIIFTATISSPNLLLNAVISTGTWSIKISARII